VHDPDAPTEAYVRSSGSIRLPSESLIEEHPWSKETPSKRQVLAPPPTPSAWDEARVNRALPFFIGGGLLYLGAMLWLVWTIVAALVRAVG
jgi:hypothetical protein